MLGQFIAIMLSLSDPLRKALGKVLGRPYVLVLFALFSGTCSVLSFMSSSHQIAQAASLLNGLANTPLFFAWGTFFCNRQPRICAITIALSFVVSCLIALGIGMLGAYAIVGAIVALPALSMGFWLVVMGLGSRHVRLASHVQAFFVGPDINHAARFAGPAMGASSPAVTDRDDAKLDRAASLASNLAHHLGDYFTRLRSSIEQLFDRNLTLATFAVCVFVIYLMEQFVFSGDNNPPGYLLITIGVALFILLVFVLYSGFGRRKDPDALWPLFILLMFGALLTIPFLWGSSSDTAANISIVASRSLTTLTWIVLTTTIGRHSLEPFRAFAIGTLIVSLIPWITAFALSMAATAYFPSLVSHVEVLSLMCAFILMGSITVQVMRLYTLNKRLLQDALAYEGADTGGSNSGSNRKLNSGSNGRPAKGLRDTEGSLSARKGGRGLSERGKASRSNGSSSPVALDRHHKKTGGFAGSDGQQEDPQDAALNAFQLRLEQIAQTHHLTARETEILAYIVQGRTLPEISERLMVSLNTVRTHYGHVYQKLDAHKKGEVLDLFEQGFDKRHAAPRMKP
jgi:DNA-binding CsgD family transcriptional regulator